MWRGTDVFMSVNRKSQRPMAAASALALSNTFTFKARTAMRTGGPDNDDDEEALVRKLMPIMAAVITLALVFS